MNEITLTIKTGNPDLPACEQKCSVGVRGADLIPQFGTLPGTLAAIKVNNETVSLASPLEFNAVAEPVFLESSEGSSIYRRTLAFLLAVAARKLFPERQLYIGHSLGHSFYYTFNRGDKPKQKEIQQLAAGMREYAQKDISISNGYMAYAEALDFFKKTGQNDTALLLEGRNESKVRVNECDGFIDLYIAPLLHRTGLLTVFDLMPYKDGFLLRFPTTGHLETIETFKDIPILYNVYSEYKKWGRIVGVESVGLLNRMISDRTIRDYIRTAEAFQEKKLADIADQIYKKKDTVKTILIAGPSSSGKTTTAKRLSIALKVMGIEPIAISLDNYYLGTDKTPRDEKGDPDFECLEALDVPYLNEQLLALLDGKEVTLPMFDFRAGKRKEEGGRTIKLERRTMLIIEGIHGLNDALTPQIKKETKFKLYVSALTQLNLDDHNRIPTSDNRLLRRLVRDNQFRGAVAERTLQMWPSVQRGEKKYIFPFQNSADAAFNSALDYELAVLKFYAEPLLRTIKPRMKEYSEAVRLLAFLENFQPIPPQYVPSQSILREFIGDSEFKY
ncbi:MAG: nucleoside kinase [Treponema sp.]|nr:nucleoside kinase [Treponema sp.]